MCIYCDKVKDNESVLVVSGFPEVSAEIRYTADHPTAVLSILNANGVEVGAAPIEFCPKCGKGLAI